MGYLCIDKLLPLISKPLYRYAICIDILYIDKFPSCMFLSAAAAAAAEKAAAAEEAASGLAGAEGGGSTYVTISYCHACQSICIDTLRRMTNVFIDKLLPCIAKPMYRYAEKDDKRMYR